jgi:hypothetical protein
MLPLPLPATVSLFSLFFFFFFFVSPGSVRMGRSGSIPSGSGVSRTSERWVGVKHYACRGFGRRRRDAMSKRAP